MKRKIFSKLLMVAMLVASVSMFVSCKDYDDDIKKNSDAISSLQQTLNNLQSALDQAKSDAATAHATFATKVELGQVDTAVKALQEEIKALATKTALEDAIAKVNEAIGKNATKEELAELSSMVAAINTDLDAIGEWQKTTDDAIKTANENIGKQEEALAALALVVAAGDQTNADAIAALKTALEKAIKDGDKANSDAIAALKTALEKSIAEGDNTNATAIAALEEVVGTKADAKALTDAVKKLEDAIATKANQSALDALSKLVDAKATIASVDELEAALTEKIADAVTELEKVKETMATASDINDIKDAMKKADEAIKKNLDAINLLQVFIAKRLTSLVFIPDLYIDGMEAVEVLTMKDSILALVDETKRTQVTELWGVLLTNNKVAVPDSALTTWYKEPNYINKTWKVGSDSYDNGAALTKSDGSQGIAYYEFAPLAKANYHVNPSTANLDGAELSFFANVAHVEDKVPYWTRAPFDGELATPVPAKIERTSDVVENGILTVPFKVNRDLLDGIRYIVDKNGVHHYSENEAFIALQAHVKDEAGNDTTVTSDYALLTPNQYEIVALGGTWMHDPKEDHKIGSDHLWTKLIAPETEENEKGKLMPVTSGFMLYEEGKLNNVPYYSPIKVLQDNGGYRLPIVYNTAEGLDLSKYVTTHYREGYRDPNGKERWSNYDLEMNDQLMADLGLHYEFEAIHYISGSNKTDEWEHIQLTGENNSIAFPRSVTSEGKRIDDQVAGREVIGRMPIVRANLVTETGEVLAIGYILLEIVSTEAQTQDVNIDLTDAYMNCTAPASITWSQVEALILAKVGLSKTEFEATYKLETVATPNDLAGRFYSFGTTPGWGDNIIAEEIGGLYGGTLQNKQSAVQYVKQGTAWKSIQSVNEALLKANASDINGSDAAKKAAALAKLVYPLGSVYETHNSEQQQTTVLEWNVGSEVQAGVAYTNVANGSISSTSVTINSNQSRATSTEWAMIKSGASVASKGLSTEDITVTVAYKQYNNTTGKYNEAGAIYVTLRIPAGKLHFAYGEVSGKDLGHWYQNNSWLNSTATNESDAIEIHLNTPTPASTNAQATGITSAYSWDGTSSKTPVANLQDIDFNKILQQTFMNDLVGISEIDLTNFSKFEETNFSFHLVEPVLNENAWNLNSSKASKNTWKNGSTTITDAQAAANSWTVKGVTGNEYLLYLTKAEDATSGGYTERYEIAAYKDAADDNKVHFISDQDERTVVILKYSVNFSSYATGAYADTPGTQIALMSNRYAQDILNAVGRFDQAGTDLNTNANGVSYLSSEDKTFTAFISIKNENDCYNMLMPNSYFKVRWLRPINIFNVGKSWNDATNVIQSVDVASLVAAKDWRGIAVSGGLTTETGNTNAQFYGIRDSSYCHFYVDTTAIRTDHYLPVGSRTAYKSNQVAEIEALKLRESISSLSPNFLWTNAKSLGDDKKLKLFYKNNATNVGIFHIYVPVYVAYSFGEFDYNGTYGEGGNAVSVTLKSDANNAPRFNFKAVADAINNGARTTSADNTVNKATSVDKIKAPLYTQKVYAVITIGQTHGSETQPTGARNK